VQRIPAYQRIEEDIRTKVREGLLPAGTMLASRHNLARSYGVALSTAQQAIANLVAEGLLESFDRRGTFVAHPRASTGEPNHAAPDVSGADGVGPVIYAHPPISAPSSATSTVTLGIVATALIDTTAAPDVGSLWARLAIRALEQTFSEAGGTTRYFDRYPEDCKPRHSAADEEFAIPLGEAISQLKSTGVGALAIVGLCDAKDMSDEVIAAVDVEQIPTVYISWHEVQPPLAQVFYDNRYAGYQAAQHLLRRGYSRILFIVPCNDTWLLERIVGARNAVKHAGLPEDAMQLCPADPLEQLYSPQSSATAVYSLAGQLFGARADELFVKPSEPWGIIAPNDDIAYAIRDAALDAGRIPGSDFGLVGFDDDPRSSRFGLTTVRPPVEAMGEEAGRLLLRALQGDRKGHLVRLRSQLIPRTSTLLRRA
jgi:DNA-binding LacI/PurR family transcriptional regulator